MCISDSLKLNSSLSLFSEEPQQQQQQKKVYFFFIITF
jgi:hypothetical protein